MTPCGSLRPRWTAFLISLRPILNPLVIADCLATRQVKACRRPASLVCISVLLWSGTAAAAPVTAGADRAVSTTITSKKMTVKNHESQAIFEGAVVLTRGTLLVHSDRMVVSFGSQEANGGEDQKAREVSQKKGPETVGNRAVNKIAVSYTHLTLPTIYSV